MFGGRKDFWMWCGNVSYSSRNFSSDQSSTFDMHLQAGSNMSSVFMVRSQHGQFLGYGFMVMFFL